MLSSKFSFVSPRTPLLLCFFVITFSSSELATLPHCLKRCSPGFTLWRPFPPPGGVPGVSYLLYLSSSLFHPFSLCLGGYPYYTSTSPCSRGVPLSHLQLPLSVPRYPETPSSLPSSASGPLPLPPPFPPPFFPPPSAPFVLGVSPRLLFPISGAILLFLLVLPGGSSGAAHALSRIYRLLLSEAFTFLPRRCIFSLFGLPFLGSFPWVRFPSAFPSLLSSPLLLLSFSRFGFHSDSSLFFFFQPIRLLSFPSSPSSQPIQLSSLFPLSTSLFLFPLLSPFGASRWLLGRCPRSKAFTLLPRSCTFSSCSLRPILYDFVPFFI